jgi:cytoskeleton protein RodZ
MLGTPLALAAEGRIRREARHDRVRLQLANPPAPPASPQAATAPDPPQAATAPDPTQAATAPDPPQAATAPDPPQAATAPDPPTPLDVAAWQLLPLLEAAGERWAHMAAPPSLMLTAPSGPWPPLSRSEIRQ